VYADLHIHSIHSDGLLSPSEILKIAKEFELKTVAITDHDSVSGVKETITLAGNEIEVIPAAEISSNIGKLDIHILGYYVDYENAELLSCLDNFKQHRLSRAKKIIENLYHDGVKLDFERIKTLAQNGSLGRPHIAEALLKNGYVNSINEAFARYLGYHTPYYVPKMDIHPKEVIQKIKDWRGISVIAHPGAINNEDLIYQLIKDGALGLEVWHPEHNRKWQDTLYQIALKDGLLMTGGSDFHGFRAEFSQIGNFGCGKKEVAKLKKAADKE